MIIGLFQSPFTAKKVFEWRNKLESNELMVREIIDIDSSYVESENGEQNLNFKKSKPKNENDKLKKVEKKL